MLCISELDCHTLIQYPLYSGRQGPITANLASGALQYEGVKAELQGDAYRALSPRIGFRQSARQDFQEPNATNTGEIKLAIQSAPKSHIHRKSAPFLETAPTCEASVHE